MDGLRIATPAEPEPEVDDPDPQPGPDSEPDAPPPGGAAWGDEPEDAGYGRDRGGVIAAFPPTDRRNPHNGQVERTFYDARTGLPIAAFVIAPDTARNHAAAFPSWQANPLTHLPFNHYRGPDGGDPSARPVAIARTAPPLDFSGEPAPLWPQPTSLRDHFADPQTQARIRETIADPFRALHRPPPFVEPVPPLPGEGEPDLGMLAREGESNDWSGAHHPGTVSTGKGDKGKQSYGAYQYSSAAKIPQDFFRRQGKPWAATFANLQPGTAAYKAEWERVSRLDPIAFARAQHEYTYQWNYLPQARQIAKTAGIDLSQRSLALRNAVFSASIQFNPYGHLFADVIKRENDRAGGQASDDDLIKAIYAERGRVGPDGHLVHFRGSPDFEEGLKNRFAKEENRGLDILSRERLGERFDLTFSGDTVK